MQSSELTQREKNILRYIVQQFILTAAPVGSRNITKKYEIGLSPASVRNIMSDLEDSGFIDHPHTSAGRIPTDKGYRVYVDYLMDLQKIKGAEKNLLNKELTADHLSQNDIIETTTRLLSRITNQLACVVYPDIESGILTKLQLVLVSPKRLLVILSIASGLLKTITLELNYEIEEKYIDPVQSLLNEKLSGLKLSEIRETFAERIKSSGDLHENPLLKAIYSSLDKIFKDTNIKEKVVVSGGRNLIKQPEFENPGKFESIVELIEDKDIIVHILDKPSLTAENSIPKTLEVNVAIGSELNSKNLEDYSVVIKEYKIGKINGKLGIVGPKRMDYSKIIAIIDYTSKLLTEVLNKS
ncbi:MAG: heat-inducible transcriptional repressor HrcA [Ignavibacteriaceae bacterium]|nr:heat-inducible transcriptional repressor HrcA [Ignavibacteriaceae bacterium]